MYPHPQTLNPINVAEGGTGLSSEWGQTFNAARAAGLIHRTQAIAAFKPRDPIKWTPRDGMQLNPTTPKTSVPRVTYGYPGPVLLGPADSNLYRK